MENGTPQGGQLTIGSYLECGGYTTAFAGYGCVTVCFWEKTFSTVKAGAGIPFGKTHGRPFDL